MDLFLIDGIAPFFRGYDQEVVNWSKAPFSHIESGDHLDFDRCRQIRADFKTFCRKAAGAGYNAITLDDLAHLCIFGFYDAALVNKIADYRCFFGELFKDAVAAGLTPYITTDLLFFNEAIDRHIASNDDALRTFAADACRQLFEKYPMVGGIIVRIGEADGLDVEGDFHSRLVIRRPQQARKMIQALLPVFEEFDRQLVFRTWSVGVGRVGDIIWNPDTFDAVFAGLENDHLIISMKYGQSDFFRYLPLNRLFFRGGHRKLVEFQARREYEGFGEYPSFIGYDYEKVRNKLVGQHNVVGMSVWCQTGGWSGFRRLTFLDDNAVWNEINTFVTVRLFRDGITADQAIQHYYREHYPDPHWRPLQELLRLSDEVIKELLYIEDFASRKIYFRRLRVPPLVTVYWRHIVANHFMRKFMRCYVGDGQRTVKQGFRALQKIKRMQELAGPLGLPVEDLKFQYDTFKIIATVREYYFLDFTDELEARLTRMKEEYEAKYDEPRYTLMLDFSRVKLRRAHLHLMLKMMFRGEHGYRLFDRIVTLNLLSVLYPMLKRFGKNAVPEFASESAMGFDSIFK
ncbi:hypothetical protein PDESU_00232 [Pontiella desulfatans]|uniref:Glycosyl hydrolase family 67 n=1 Tax=Pontiella desulfatans TaxID=2750659 RepID=A0A6C2TVV2_PONDE|nr:hypothetical protein [Pontiella desulfatans]VGO11687.1 hypothetical protein PDESU_00232 [Pontiella desulfatans]